MRYKYKVLSKLCENVNQFDLLQEQAAKLPAGTAGVSYCRPPTLKDAALILHDCWQAITTQTIAKCWRRSNLLPPDTNSDALNSSDSQGEDPRADTGIKDIIAQLANIKLLDEEAVEPWIGIEDDPDMGMEAIIMEELTINDADPDVALSLASPSMPESSERPSSHERPDDVEAEDESASSSEDLTKLESHICAAISLLKRDVDEDGGLDRCLHHVLERITQVRIQRRPQRKIHEYFSARK